MFNSIKDEETRGTYTIITLVIVLVFILISISAGIIAGNYTALKNIEVKAKAVEALKEKIELKLDSKDLEHIFKK